MDAKTNRSLDLSSVQLTGVRFDERDAVLAAAPRPPVPRRDSSYVYGDRKANHQPHVPCCSQESLRLFFQEKISFHPRFPWYVITAQLIVDAVVSYGTYSLGLAAADFFVARLSEELPLKIICAGIAIGNFLLSQYVFRKAGNLFFSFKDNFVAAQKAEEDLRNNYVISANAMLAIQLDIVGAMKSLLNVISPPQANPAEAKVAENPDVVALRGKLDELDDKVKTSKAAVGGVEAEKRKQQEAGCCNRCFSQCCCCFRLCR